MSATITVIPGKVFAATEKITIAKLNQLGMPTVTGTVLFSQLTDWNSVATVSKTFTYTGAADQITATAHGLSAPSTVDNAVRVLVSNSGGTLPTGLVASTTFFYYARVVDANTLTLHNTAVGALNNTDRVNITGAGTGTNTITWSIYALGRAVIYNVGTAKFELGEVTRVSMPEMIGATAVANGARGAAPQPTTADVGKFLRADGTWASSSNTGSNSDLFNSMTHY